MMTNRLLAAALAASLIFSPAAHAQDAAIKADQQCLALSVYFAGQKKKDIREFGAMAAYFYLGRLQARGPEATSPAALTAVLDGVTEAELLAHGERCLGEFEKGVEVFESMGSIAEPKARD
jgi:hypothetical protein